MTNFLVLEENKNENMILYCHLLWKYFSTKHTSKTGVWSIIEYRWNRFYFKWRVYKAI